MYTRIALVGVLLLSAHMAMAQSPHRGGGEMLDRMDADSDGSVTRDEFMAAREQMFSKRDRNSDGYLDSADFGERAQRRAGERIAKMREETDTDGDGKISKDEFVGAQTPLFDGADKDSNNVLDATELANAKEAMHSRMKERRGQ
jgi:Ca2+-binding EF-hand superfamily protein